jgi:hypothetical protein
MYREFIQRKLSPNENLGIYVSPNLPGGKLGRILNVETSVKPSEVVAFYIDSGLFSTVYFIITATRCFFGGGSVNLENLRGAKADGKRIELMTAAGAGASTQSVKLGDEQAAALLAKVLDDLAYWDPEKEKATAAASEETYAQFEGTALDWLKLRDEVMRTIDMLHERFQDGKLSLIQYEEKKTELLARL